MHIRDQLDVIYEDQSFADLFSTRGQPAEAPWRLVLVCIFQFLEGLTDRQAAEAVQQRIDWKYALALEGIGPNKTCEWVNSLTNRCANQRTALLIIPATRAILLVRPLIPLEWMEPKACVCH